MGMGNLTLQNITNVLVSGNRGSGTYSNISATNSNLVGNIFSTNNAAQSTSLHLADGYITVENGNAFNVGATITSNGGNASYIAVGANGQIGISSNGRDWSLVDDGVTFSTTTINDITHNGRDLWVAVANSGKIATSSNGRDWSLVDNGVTFPSGIIRSLAHNGRDLWVAVSNNNKIGISSNGRDWSLVDDGVTFSSEIYAVSHDQIGLWVVVGGTGISGGQIATSLNGINWKLVDDGITFSNGITTITYGKNSFGKGLWVATSGSKIATSLNGNDWTIVDDGVTFSGQTIESVVYEQNLWVAVCSSGIIGRSYNGRDWEIIENGSVFGTTIQSITFNGKDLWVAVANSGKIGTASTNLDDWTLVDNGSTFAGNINAVEAIYGANAGLVGQGSEYNGNGVIGIGDGYKGIGVLGIADGDGYAPGIKGVGGRSGGAGVEGHGGNNDGYGVIGYGGYPGGHGLYGIGGPKGGKGLLAIGGNDSGDGYGVYGISGLENGVAVYGEGRGTGAAGKFNAIAGPGAILESVSGAPLRIIPSDEPSSSERGDHYVDANTNKLLGYDGTNYHRYIPRLFTLSSQDSKSSTGDFTNATFTVPTDVITTDTTIIVTAGGFIDWSSVTGNVELNLDVNASDTSGIIASVSGDSHWKATWTLRLVDVGSSGHYFVLSDGLIGADDTDATINVYSPSGSTSVNTTSGIALTLKITTLDITGTVYCNIFNVDVV